MFCAISGVTPEVPVVSAKSGLLYEKRLALKLVSEAAQEPGQQVGESLTLEERCWAGVLGCTSAGRPTSPHCSLPWMKAPHVRGSIWITMGASFRKGYARTGLALTA
jgi:hypothetical protein